MPAQYPYLSFLRLVNFLAVGTVDYFERCVTFELAVQHTNIAALKRMSAVAVVLFLGYR